MRQNFEKQRECCECCTASCTECLNDFCLNDDLNYYVSEDGGTIACAKCAKQLLESVEGKK